MILALALLAAAQAGGRNPEMTARELPPLQTVTLSGEYSLAEAVAEISRQAGLPIQTEDIDGSERAKVDWKDRPVLAALDDLCRARGKGTVKAGDSLTLALGADLPHAVAHHRQFRAEVADVIVTVRRTPKGTTRTISVQLSLAGQPGTSPLPSAGVRVEEAIDDTGMSLLGPETAQRMSSWDGSPIEEGDDPGFLQFRGAHFGMGQPWERANVALRGPGRGAAKIERLRVRLLLSFPKQYVDESVPVAEPKGREIAFGPAKFTILSFEQKERTATLRAKFTAPEAQRHRSYPTFELLDAAGNVMSRGGGGTVGQDYAMDYRLTSDEPVVTMRCQAYVGRIVVGVPLEFTNIPLPGK
jgi:hypothetical protein